MPLVVQARDAAGEVIPSVFQRVATEGDAVRLRSAEPGKRQIIKQDDASEIDTDNFTWLFDLDFNYLVGVNQLEVYTMTSDGLLRRIESATTIVDSGEGGAGGDLDLNGGVTRYFTEVAPKQVRVHNLGTGDTFVLFVVPHTATPSLLSGKVTIENQAEGAGVELLGPGNGFFFLSPNGTRYLIRVDDSGNLVAERR